MKTVYVLACLLMIIMASCTKENEHVEFKPIELELDSTMTIYKNDQLIGIFDNDMIDRLYANEARCIMMYAGRSILYHIDSIEYESSTTRIYIRGNQMKYIEYNTDVLNYIYESESNVIKLTFKIQKHEKN